MDQLAAIRSFVQVIDKGGFAPAGRALGLSGPMVGNHVRFLEGQLGGLLLKRTTRAQRLTELGRAYLERCRNVLAELEAAEAEAQELLDVPRGRLCVTAPQSIGSVLLPPIIADFVRSHAEMQVELRLDDGRLDLLANDCDAAVRVGSLEDATLVTRALAPLELQLCASPDYVARRGRPRVPKDLKEHDCLDFSAQSTPGTWRFVASGETHSINISGPMRANGGFALQAAARAGLGIVLLPQLVVREDVESGQLVTLLDEFRPESRPVQLLTHPDHHPTRALRALVDTLVKHLASRLASSSH